jgi:hypothetical protein
MLVALTTLPNELLHDITELLDQQSLLCCILTCRLLAEVVTPKLWSVIPRLTPKKTIGVIQALAGSPNCGTHVLEVHVSGPFRHKVSAPRPPTFYEKIAPIPRVLGDLFQSPKPQGATSIVFTAGNSEFSLETFSTAFQKMIHLRKLVIYEPFHSTLWEFTLFIPTLREIFVDGPARSTELLSWIRGQRNLIQLRLCIPLFWPHEDSFINQTFFFPHLHSLTTTPYGATHLLRSPSISNLIIEGIHPERRKDLNVRGLAKAIVNGINVSGALRRLTLAGNHDPVLELFALLQGRLPALGSLRVILTDCGGPQNVRDLPVTVIPGLTHISST